jgi:oligopeptide/dipeptide ABC transporter ATP-binding protein
MGFGSGCRDRGPGYSIKRSCARHPLDARSFINGKSGHNRDLDRFTVPPSVERSGSLPESLEKRPILSVKNLKVCFETGSGPVQAVEDLSYDLSAGETLAIVGESGSGKSVHALSLLRLLPPPPFCKVEGEIRFHEENILSLPPEPMRRLRGARLAMIFQEPMTSLNPVLTIGEQIAEPLMLHKGKSRSEALKEAAILLGKVGIPDPENRLKNYPHQFSGGMRQRAMIAMALSCGPEILIADEPTTALDVTIQAQILDLLKDLQKEFHMAIILITHNIGIVADMADKIIVMYAGRPVEQAQTLELFKNPAHPYTQGLMNAIPSLEVRKDHLESIPGRPPDLKHKILGCPFFPRCSKAMDRCRSNDPPFFKISDAHISSCWLSEDLGAAFAREARACQTASKKDVAVRPVPNSYGEKR